MNIRVGDQLRLVTDYKARVTMLHPDLNAASVEVEGYHRALRLSLDDIPGRSVTIVTPVLKTGDKVRYSPDETSEGVVIGINSQGNYVVEWSNTFLGAYNISNLERI
jgi:predicted ester cyclase